MRKQNRQRNILKSVCFIITGVILNIFSLEPAFAAPPTYPVNQDLIYYPSIIIPNSGYLEMKYDADPLENGKYPYAAMMIMIQFGPMTDYQFYWWNGSQLSDENTTIFNNFGYEMFYGAYFKGKTGEMRNSALKNNTSGRLEYKIVTNDGYTLMYRVDYNRCVKSSVFLSGVATECRAEKIGEGAVQYQPYTQSGERVEIPAEEDAILTAETLNWRAEPGDWGPEWYRDDSNSGDDTTGGTDDTTGGTDDNTDETGNMGNTDSIGNKDGIDTVSSTGDESNNSSYENTDNYENSQISTNGSAMNYNVVAGIGRRSTSTNNDGTNSEGIKSEDSSTDTVVTSDTSNTDEKEQIDEQMNHDSKEEVETPVLDKESGLDWLAPVLIASGLAMAMVGWWFLFFGERKLTEREERKK